MNGLFFCVIIIILFVIGKSDSQDETNNECGRLFLTVSAVTNQLVLNWDFTCSNYPDHIALSSRSLKSIEGKDAYFLEYFSIYEIIASKNSKNGSYQTTTSFDLLSFPGNWDKDDLMPIPGNHCLPYWITTVKNKKYIDENCLNIEPTWMHRFGKLTLESIMIPGTHNSGSWIGMPNLLKYYILNQDQEFWNQLVFGIRFFDIRVGYYENDDNNKFWINHNFIPVTPLKPELLSVLNFLKKTTTEVIILDFHQFPIPEVFLERYHDELLEMLQELFGEYILPPQQFRKRQAIALEQIWKSGKRLIISYNSREQVRKKKWLWGGIYRKWGNKNTPEGMYAYMNQVFNFHIHPKSLMCVLMAEPTPAGLFDLIMNSLADLADGFNPTLNDWLRDENRSVYVNIIAVDFFLSSDIINTAIETNQKKVKDVF
ncbi:hypothetical protein ILUMI_26360 [Ignelater luminosus]|uniref:Uncharacterized protein n=1 Tax=Ignelater luminosus TaxID=2038154 RepID=A0A8K0C4F0_IGNLU|nr:hypothetical protein ILUMI_26360 [Ignelater luminosus]